LIFFIKKLIHNKVFTPDSLRSLDEYFIKKLKDIITVGREILNLDSRDMHI